MYGEHLLPPAQHVVYSMSAIKDIFYDKSDNVLNVGATVEVGEPMGDEVHSHGFTGTIDSFRNGHIVVEDMEGNFFEVSPSNITLY